MIWTSQPDQVWSVLQNPNPDFERELYTAMRVRDPGYAMTPRFRTGIWDGWTPFYDKKEHRIATGLLGFVEELGYPVEEQILAQDPLAEIGWDLDAPPLRNPSDPTKDIIPLEYQKDILAQVALGRRRGIFDHLTASGKSVGIGLLCKAAPSLKILCTVPTNALLEQLKQDLAIMLQEPVGQVGLKRLETDYRVTVAMDGRIKSLLKTPQIRKLAEETQMLIVDELQTATPAVYPFYRQCQNAYYRFGFSGSFFDVKPTRILGTAGFFGSVISTVGDEETKEAGRTVPPKFEFLEYPLRKCDADYNTAYDELIVENVGLNRFFAKQILPHYDEGRTILVLVARVAQCDRFKEALAELGIESERYHGKISTHKRREMRESFKQGKIPVLIATQQTLGVGVNIPRIEVLLNLGCGLSDNMNKQKYGRSLRSFEDKESVTILEPYLTGNRWFLRHSKARLSLAKSYSTGTGVIKFADGTHSTF